MGCYKDLLKKLYPIQDKELAAEHYIELMLNRTASMFIWEGLPDTIPQRMLELYLQTNGQTLIAQHEGDLYAFFGGLGGEPDEYYQPTIYTVANPFLKLSTQYHIGVDGVLGRNDTMMSGLLPLIKRSAYLLSENDVSLWIASVNQRIASLITADNENARKAAEEFLTKIFKGDLGAIMSQGLVESIHTQPYGAASNNSITQLIELEQYLKASLLNDLGLNANYNMKRESLSMTESQMNHDALLPLVDDMLHQRERMCEEVNQMFGTNISVHLHSAWEDLQEETAAQIMEDEQEGGEENEPDIKESLSELEE